ncbi:hypothetical protein RhiirA1_461631 [Rhizophagus irregularis]|uniref:Uncharacterized protein n=1 Tax=Rhizophagus irregularis TaxID=588596 RepID=A0A2I1F6N1_9GLOM|nr:hypothetical protein RhiirA1_461631 [Rhizophagus irregularis]PKY30025.1 hypothetical protein RhiirB3_446917 [Rhizophagus irregularis]
MGKTLKQKSIRSRKLSKSGCKIPNAFIIFSNKFYDKYYRINKTKRTIAMKRAKLVWDSMSAQEKIPYYFQYEHLRSRVNCNPRNEIIFVLNENGDDQYNKLVLNENMDQYNKLENIDDQCDKLFNEFINPEMYQE